MPDIDTSNRHLVGAFQDGIIIQFPPRGRIPKEQALNLAAWLVALADPGRERFDQVLSAVMNT